MVQAASEDFTRQRGECYPSESDDRLKGEVAALLARHFADIYSYLLAAVLNPHDAEDLFQEVCLVAIAKASQFPSGNFRAWTLAIARRCVLEHMKKASRKAAHLMPEVLDQLERKGPEEPLESAEVEPRLKALRDCLESLGGISRQVLDLRYRDRLDVNRIASSVGKTVRATYILLDTARRTLRKCAERKLTEAV